MISRERALIKNTLVLGIGNFLPKITAFITIPILTGYLTQEEYGTFDLVLVLSTLLLPTFSLQIQAAAFRFLIDERANHNSTIEIVTNVFAFIFLVSIPVLLLAYFFTPGDLYIKFLICIFLLSDILLQVLHQISRGLAENRAYSISAILQGFSNCLFVVLFTVFLKLGLNGALLSSSLSSFISFIWLSLHLKIWKYVKLTTANRKYIKTMISYSWPMVPNALALWVMNVSDRLVITFSIGLTANAIYAVANKIPSILNIAHNTFTMAWQENASIVSKDEDAEQYYSKMFRNVFDLMAGLLGLLICLTPFLFCLLIRGEYSDAYNQMPILFMGMFFYGMSTYLGGIYVAYKNSKSIGMTTVTAAACNLFITIALIQYIGLYAASVSTVVSFLFLMTYRMVDVKKIVDIEFNVRYMLVVICFLLLECVLCFSQKAMLNVINIIIGLLLFIVLNHKLIKTIFKKINNGKI